MQTERELQEGNKIVAIECNNQEEDKKCKSDRNKLSQKSIVIYTWCLILWTVKIILDMVYQEYIPHPKIAIADWVCLIFYIIILIMWILQYKKEKRERKGEII